VNHSRPKNLNLFTIRFPLPAIVSILHRVSGFALFVLIPFFIWILSLSLNVDSFNTLHQWLGNFFVKFIFWVCLIPLCYHLVAGIRHLLMDLHYGSTLKSSKLAAQLTFIISAVLVLLVGIWLW